MKGIKYEKYKKEKYDHIHIPIEIKVYCRDSFVQKKNVNKQERKTVTF